MNEIIDGCLNSINFRRLQNIQENVVNVLKNMAF